MSALFFFQIAALIVIFTLCSLLLSVALGWLYIKYMPAIMAAVQQGLEGVDDLDQHYGENPDVHFYDRPSTY